MKLTPVDFDPFAEAPGTANQPAAPAQATKPKLTAVDYDPFDPSTQRAPKAPKPTQPGIAARLRSMLPRDTAPPRPKRAPVTTDTTPVPPQVDTDRTIGQVAGDIGNKVVGGAGALVGLHTDDVGAQLREMSRRERQGHGLFERQHTHSREGIPHPDRQHAWSPQTVVATSSQRARGAVPVAGA